MNFSHNIKESNFSGFQHNNLTLEQPNYRALLSTNERILRTSNFMFSEKIDDTFEATFLLNESQNKIYLTEGLE